MIPIRSKLAKYESPGSPVEYTVSVSKTREGPHYHVRSEGKVIPGMGMALYHQYGHLFTADFGITRWNCPQTSNWVEFHTTREEEWFAKGPGKHRDWAKHVYDGETPPSGMRISFRQIFILLVLEKTRTLDALWEANSDLSPDIIQPLAKLAGVIVPLPKGDATRSTECGRLPEKIRELWQLEVPPLFPEVLATLPENPMTADAKLAEYQARKDDRTFLKKLHRN